jgi:lipopolysaccharide/colanic/teichoic acid biosynthesis glycosyltransferase
MKHLYLVDLKRVLDVSVAAIGLLVLSPLLLALAILIRLDSRGPALFRGERLGRNGRTFWMYKFRTMVHVNKLIQPDRVASYNDPRITRLGAHLRRLKLDELPQLINVLRGEMSLVGPRPEGLKYLHCYTSEQWRVLNVRPGITGLAQLRYIEEDTILGNGQDYETGYVEQILPRKLALDLWYIDHWSFALDLQILLRTALMVLLMRRSWPLRGQYCEV